MKRGLKMRTNGGVRSHSSSLRAIRPFPPVLFPESLAHSAKMFFGPHGSWVTICGAGFSSMHDGPRRETMPTGENHDGQAVR